MKQHYEQEIASLFEACVSGTIARLSNEDTHRPFHAALLSTEALFWSRFERSFSTSFGQSVIEKISRIAALAGGASEAENQRVTTVSLTEGQWQAVDHHMGALRERRLGRPPAWMTDKADVLDAGQLGSQTIKTGRVISDLWWRKDGIDHFMSIKTVKPNIDQTAEAKRDLLKLQLHNPKCRVFFGLYYNPYGAQRQDYAWSPPKGVFDFQHDQVVLIGKSYWDTLGGVGFYEEVLAIAQACGQRTRALIGQLHLS